MLIPQLVLALAIGSAHAFAPAASSRARVRVRVAAEPEQMDLDLDDMQKLFDEAVEADGGSSTAATTVNGWAPDDKKFCYGLPGALAPMGDFDPIGFARLGTPLNDIKRNR